MAGRPPKESIDYAGWDVNIFDNDPKIDKLLDAQGCIGFVIYFYLCQRAYGSNGYYYSWCYDDAATTARKIGGGAGAKSVEETVRYCLQIGLFDKGLFDRWNILTSRGIQKRYRQVAITRIGNSVIEEYWLLKKEESAGLNFRALKLNYDPSKLNYDPLKSNYSGRKGKDSKVKESKEERVGANAPTPPFSIESIEYKSSKYLADKILERNPGAVKVPKDDEGIFKWCVHIERLLRIDERPPDELRAVLVFATKDPFWSSNILSTSKLREKYDTLLMQMKSKGQGGTKELEEISANNSGYYKKYGKRV